jgi:CheY-like chemotaxis protein
MSGTVQVESVLGQGSVFTFTAKLRAAGPAEAHHIQSTRNDLPVYKGLTALLVEDNPVNQLVARRLLEKMGLEVEVAEHGGEALEKLEGKAYAVVFMDCQMPVMDGFEATARIRARETDRRRELIIAMTANIHSEDRRRCLEAGMDDFIPKPILVGHLLATLRKHLPEPDR